MSFVYIVLITNYKPKMWAFNTEEEAYSFRDQYLLNEYYEYNDEEYDGSDIIGEMIKYDYHTQIEKLQIN